MVTQNEVILTIPNYKKDDGTPATGTGALALNPIVDDPSTLFCLGSDIISFIFSDATVFDCQLGVEPNLPNIENRYVQYVYGTWVSGGIPKCFHRCF
ncbi:MAG: hypothetical protein IPN68_14610 [Bacteroidetes bacterium]|nr:hypothetical protein [Bacteroidota bacterium]